MAANLKKPAFEDYPYDKRYDGCSTSQLTGSIIGLQGLEKLTAVKNRSLARYLFELWFHVKDPSARELEAESRERDEQDLRDLESMTDKALQGLYNPQCKQLAQQIVVPHRNRETMRRLRVALQRVEGRWSA